jgi:type IV pilus assembly protein PilB
MGIKNSGKAKKLGELLIEVGMVTSAQLKAAADVQRKRGGKLGDILCEMNVLSREVLMTFLGKRCGVSYVSLAEFGPVAPEVSALVSENVARRYMVVPLRRRGGELTVAMADPLDVFATDDLKASTGCDIKVVIASREEIAAAIEARYGEPCALPSVDGQVRFEDPAPVDLVKVLLDNAVRLGASAVHLDSRKDAVKVRYRLQSNLVPRPDITGGFQEGLAAKVKTMAKMNPLETRAPQEGRIRAKVSGREVDIYVSIMPAASGEKIVMRFSDGATDSQR